MKNRKIMIPPQLMRLFLKELMILMFLKLKYLMVRSLNPLILLFFQLFVDAEVFSTEENNFEVEKSIFNRFIVVGRNLEALAVMAILDEQVTKEGEKWEAPNELVNNQADTEKVDEAKKVLGIDIPSANTEQVDEATLAHVREAYETKEVDNPLEIVV